MAIKHFTDTTCGHAWSVILTVWGHSLCTEVIRGDGLAAVAIMLQGRGGMGQKGREQRETYTVIYRTTTGPTWQWRIDLCMPSAINSSN